AVQPDQAKYGPKIGTGEHSEECAHRLVRTHANRGFLNLCESALDQFQWRNLKTPRKVHHSYIRSIPPNGYELVGKLIKYLGISLTSQPDCRVRRHNLAPQRAWRRHNRSLHRPK